jgi:hypothetical protein
MAWHFSSFIWSGAMERERNNTDPDGSAEVWRSAERRRAEDIEAWLRQWFVQRRRLKACDAEASYPKGRPALE